MRNDRSFTLHIPEPGARPGGTPDFSHLHLEPAGAVRRPAIDEPGLDMRDMPYRFVRVLDENHEAVGPWAPTVAPEMLIRGLRAMMLTRIFDDRLFRAHRQGKTSFYMKSTGEEAIPVAQSLLLCPDTGLVLTNCDRNRPCCRVRRR